jgi:hypothetical protein
MMLGEKQRRGKPRTDVKHGNKMEATERDQFRERKQSHSRKAEETPLQGFGITGRQSATLLEAQIRSNSTPALNMHHHRLRLIAR